MLKARNFEHIKKGVPMTLTELANKMGIHNRAVSLYVRDLETKGHLFDYDRRGANVLFITYYGYFSGKDLTNVVDLLLAKSSITPNKYAFSVVMEHKE